MSDDRSDRARLPRAFTMKDEGADDGRKPAMAKERPAPIASPEPQAAIRMRRPMALPGDVAITPDAQDPFLSPLATSGSGIDGLGTTPALPVRRKRFSFAKLAAGAFGIVVSIAVGLWVDDLIRSLFERAPWLAWATIGVLAIGVLALLIAVGREVIAISRLTAIQALKADVEKAATRRAPAEARAAVDRVAALFNARPDTAAGRAELKALEGEIVDGPSLVDFAERELMGPLDRKARRLILDAARRVSIVTAVSPRALVDVGYVIFEAGRLIRSLATLYGGRPGTFGTLRLVRDVIAHLAVTGSIAVGDSLVQQLLGHGVASRLSARLGEGVVNGLMTARVGIAAMDLCRPMPFRALRRPGIGDFIADLTRLSGTAGTSGKAAPADADRGTTGS